ncbi:TetR/AcrR family transcriptional regulator [Pseudonocardia halophobica]|uniref:TetR/AcrR family transcriptional regulator n=1 Tax=Pseudonocardia halophobica TaxID=29401 RepID=UPI003D8B5178
MSTSPGAGGAADRAGVPGGAAGAPARRAGRPRDPEVDRKVLEAALEVYADLGWAGFNFEAVARRAGVGRPALYRRWLSARALLVDAIERSGTRIDVPDTGSVRDQLVVLARQLLVEYLGARGIAGLRLLVDARTHPEVFADLYARRNEERVRAARAIVRRGIARGELAAGTSPTLVLDAVCGAMLNHALATPDRLRKVVIAGGERYAAELVDLVLQGRPGAG